MPPDDDFTRGLGSSAPEHRWEDTLGLRGQGNFNTTRWSLVIRAGSDDQGEASEAMALICRDYWYPLYAYVRRSGRSREEAEDLTQEFFARLLERDIIGQARSERGKLRTFLLTVMKRFMINEWKRATAAKRGGGLEAVPINFDEGEERYGHEPVDNTTPDEIYERQWATTLLGRVMEVLRRDYASRGMDERFGLLKEALWWNAKEASYAELGEKIGMKENAVKQAVSRLRKQYRRELKDEIKRTLETEDEELVAAELRHLVAALRS